MPRLKVEILGDESSLVRAYKAATEQSKLFQKHTAAAATGVGSLDRSLRKGSTSMYGFAKAGLLAGGALVGVGSLVEGIDKTVKAAEKFEVAQRSMQAQLKANGENFKQVSPWVDKLSQANVQLGFTSTQTAQAFTQLDRASGSAATSYKYMAVTADLAAARHIDLSKAALIVGKVIDGNVGALNRYGIAVPKGTSATDALRIAQQKLSGQAQAAVTPFARFHAVLNNIEVIIGQELLPTISKYLDKVTLWLSSAKHQAEIGNVVKTALHDIGVAMKWARDRFEEMLPTIKNLIHYGFDGIKAAIEGAKAAFGLLAAAFGKHKAEMIAAIVAIGVAITLALGPEAVAIAGAIIAVGYIKDHWGAISKWFVSFAGFMKDLFEGMWKYVEGLAEGAVYDMLVNFELLAKGAKKALGWIPFFGKSVKDATGNAISFIEGFNTRSQALLAQGGAQAGNAWANAFDKSSSAVSLPTVLGGQGSGTGGFFGSNSGSAGSMTAGKAKMLAFAKDAIGTPYVWGGAGPGGFDCSGLVSWAFANGLNVSIPHSTYAQVGMGAAVGSDTLKGATPGDVIFTQYGEGGKAGPGHEGIYIGGGQVLSAPHTGANVGISSLAGFTSGGHYTVRDLAGKTAPSTIPLPTTTTVPLPTVALPGDVAAAAAAAAKASKTKTGAASLLHGALFGSGPNGAAGQLSQIFGLDQTIGGKYSFMGTGTHLFSKQLQVSLARQGGVGSANMETLTKAHTELQKLAASFVGDAMPVALATEMSKVTKAMKRLKMTKEAGAIGNAALQKFNDAGQQIAGLQTLMQVAVPGETTDFTKQVKGLVAKQVAVLRAGIAKLQAKGEGGSGAAAQLKTQLDGALTAQQNLFQNVVATARSAYDTALSSFSSSFQKLVSDIDQQFEQQTQQYVDQVLGPQFFQGLQTPSEALLAGMQQQDTQQSLQDALVSAQQSGDPKAVQQAARAIQENELQLKATAERTQADKDYADAVRQYQNDRSIQEGQLNDSLSALGDGVQKGTMKMSDLNVILAKYGIAMDGPGGATATTVAFANDLAAATTGEGGIISSLGALQEAFAALVAWVNSNTGSSVDIPAGPSFTSENGQQAAPGATGATVASPGGNTYMQTGKGRYGSKPIPLMASGGRVLANGLAFLHAGEVVVPHGGGGGILHVTVNVPGGFVGSNRELTDTIVAALRREKTRIPSLGI